MTILKNTSLLQDNFFLTGGTALSEFYLQHRYSEDMDFFTETLPDIVPAVHAVQTACEKERIGFELNRLFATYSEAQVRIGGENLKLDFAVDSPFRLHPINMSEVYGIRYDNKIDIACNKLSALFDRNDPKDFVDVYFVHHEVMPLEELIQQAKKKHVGLEEYWLSRAFHKAKDIAFLPRMIKPLDIEQLKGFFLNKAVELMR